VASLLTLPVAFQGAGTLGPEAHAELPAMRAATTGGRVMTQEALFPLAPPESLPVQGRTPETRAASAEAAQHAAVRRPQLAQRYLDALLRAGAAGLRCPVSSICSTRAGHQVRDQIAPHGHRTGPYGKRNTAFALRVAIGKRFDHERRAPTRTEARLEKECGPCLSAS
jgi:hypothetical protein